MSEHDEADRRVQLALDNLETSGQAALLAEALRAAVAGLATIAEEEPRYRPLILLVFAQARETIHTNPLVAVMDILDGDEQGERPDATLGEQ